MNNGNNTTTKTTLTVVLPDGTTDTRKTARTYTHVIAELSTAAQQIEDATARREWAESALARFSALDPNAAAEGFYNWTNGQQVDRIRKGIAEAQARIDNAADRWYAATWCGRHDLAVKAIAKFSPAAVIVEVVDPRQS
jgi:hypothetical protein